VGQPAPDYGHPAALAKYDAEKADLHAGTTPRADTSGTTVKDVANAFLVARQNAVSAGELSPRTWKDYHAIMAMLVEGLGKTRLTSDLHPDDFAGLTRRLAEKNGPPRMGTIVQVIRCAFKYALDSELIDRPVRFGPDFKRPSKKTMRLQRAAQGAKLLTAEEIRRLIAAATVTMKAMILLGINCGLGNADCGQLPRAALDLERGILDFPRPKTGIARRCPLWPETVQAIRAALVSRPEPKKEEHARLVFITRCGDTWGHDTSESPISYEMGKLLRRLGINGRHRLGFSTLRHTFRTVADEARDQPAADYIMGHEVPHMSSVHRERISDERLKAVTDHVRGWLFTEG
jgi:integrase